MVTPCRPPRRSWRPSFPLFDAFRRFSTFFVTRTRYVSKTFHGYVRGLFQSERGTMLCMSEVNDVDHLAMQHLLSSECVDWAGLNQAIALEADALLGGDDAVAFMAFEPINCTVEAELCQGLNTTCH